MLRMGLYEVVLSKDAFINVANNIAFNSARFGRRLKFKSFQIQRWNLFHTSIFIMRNNQKVNLLGIKSHNEF